MGSALLILAVSILILYYLGKGINVVKKVLKFISDKLFFGVIISFFFR
jgi:hypothetical protein